MSPVWITAWQKHTRSKTPSSGEGKKDKNAHAWVSVFVPRCHPNFVWLCTSKWARLVECLSCARLLHGNSRAINQLTLLTTTSCVRACACVWSSELLRKENYLWASSCCTNCLCFFSIDVSEMPWRLASTPPRFVNLNLWCFVFFVLWAPAWLCVDATNLKVYFFILIIIVCGWIPMHQWEDWNEGDGRGNKNKEGSSTFKRLALELRGVLWSKNQCIWKLSVMQLQGHHIHVYRFWIKVMF